MMQLDRLTLGRAAKELGFVRDTLEKVCRLVDVLSFFESDELLANALALKGGTAINLTIFDLPRLSVDIDLDYCKSLDREEMLADREMITSKISRYMTANGYILSQKSKKFHALDSLVYEYTNSGGVKDNLKIEINYMLRCHVLPVKKREIKLLWSDEVVKVLTVAPVEIFSSKTVALLSRTAPRDLYDLHNMVRFGVIRDDQKELYRKCVVFYSAISTERPPKEFELDNIGNVTKMQIKRDLDPVLRKGERFDLGLVQEELKNFLADILVTNDNEKSLEWLPVFANYHRDGYDFDALYEDGKASLKHKKIMTHFMDDNGEAEILSNQLKAMSGFGKDGEKGFESALAALMMQPYLCNSDFRKRQNKKGQDYGWNVAIYCTPEHLWGYDTVTADYKVKPQDSWKKIVDHMHDIYSIATDKHIRKVLK